MNPIKIATITGTNQDGTSPGDNRRTHGIPAVKLIVAEIMMVINPILGAG